MVILRVQAPKAFLLLIEEINNVPEGMLGHGEGQVRCKPRRAAAWKDSVSRSSKIRKQRASWPCLSPGRGRSRGYHIQARVHICTPCLCTETTHKQATRHTKSKTGSAQEHCMCVRDRCCCVYVLTLMAEPLSSGQKDQSGGGHTRTQTQRSRRRSMQALPPRAH